MDNLRKKTEFMEQISLDSPFYTLFDYLPGISFFAKNIHFELVCANHSFLERLGIQKENQIIGKSDYDFFPRAMADHFRMDDQAVVDAKKPKTNIVELFINTDGLPDWYLTTKLPVFGKNGEVIGIMGTSHSYKQGKRLIQPLLKVEKAIQFIQDHFREQINIGEIAAQVNLSTRQLDRQFQEILKMSPQEFIARLRITTACRELSRTPKPILDVALSLGYYDQSSFTLQFRKHMETTPLKYRKQHALNSEPSHRI
jgi:AraC-like DNA-binding protein